MKFLINIYIYTYRRLFSLFMRWWTKFKANKEEHERILSARSYLVSKIKTEADIIKELESFRWSPDPMGGFFDWTPDLDSFLLKEKKDDCDGAAIYTKWLYAIIGNNTGRVYSLISKNFIKSHVICLIEVDKEYILYSNGFKSKRKYKSIDDAIQGYNNINNLKYFDYAVEITY